jgi:hypothetical protein
VIWIVLAFLGVPLWLIAGALLAAFWSRRRFQKTPGVFACKLRRLPAEDGKGWKRMTSHARWAHDVLLVHSGLALMRYSALPVARVEAGVAPASHVRLKENPVSIQLRIDDLSLVEVAAPGAAAELLAGPFAAASPKAAERVAS